MNARSIHSTESGSIKRIHSTESGSIESSHSTEGGLLAAGQKSERPFTLLPEVPVILQRFRHSLGHDHGRTHCHQRKPTTTAEVRRLMERLQYDIYSWPRRAIPVPLERKIQYKGKDKAKLNGKSTLKVAPQKAVCVHPDWIIPSNSCKTMSDYPLKAMLSQSRPIASS